MERMTIEKYCEILKAAKDINMPKPIEGNFISPEVKGMADTPMATGTSGGPKLAEPKTLGKM